MANQWIDKVVAANTKVEETLPIQFSKSQYFVVSLTCRNDSPTSIGITQGFVTKQYVGIISSISISVDCICIGY